MKVTVIVHPNAKRERIEEDLFGDLHVYVNQPPLEGKANRATISALADHFKTSKSKVQLVAGAKSKHKLFEISD